MGSSMMVAYQYSILLHQTRAGVDVAELCRCTLIAYSSYLGIQTRARRLSTCVLNVCRADGGCVAICFANLAYAGHLA